jgi:hypothetical protein
MNPHIPNGLPFWELKSWWTPKFLEGDFKSQNSLVWKVLYTIGIFLKCKCLKWASMTHLNTYNTSYGQKKGRESKCQFDFRPLKIKNCLNVLGGLFKKLKGLQSGTSPNFKNLETPTLGFLRQNDIWVQPSWLDTKNTIGGKALASPSPGHGECCESLYARSSFVHQKCSNYALINLLFRLCRCVNDWLTCHLFQFSSWSSGMPFLSLKCCELGSILQLFFLLLFLVLDLHFDSCKECENGSHEKNEYIGNWSPITLLIVFCIIYHFAKGL